jgi:hypothetical protein
LYRKAKNIPICKERQQDTQTGRLATFRQIYRQAGRPAGRQAERQTDRQTYRQAVFKVYMYTE